MPEENVRSDEQAVNQTERNRKEPAVDVLGENRRVRVAPEGQVRGDAEPESLPEAEEDLVGEGTPESEAIGEGRWHSVKGSASAHQSREKSVSDIDERQVLAELEKMASVDVGHGEEAMSGIDLPGGLLGDDPGDPAPGFAEVKPADFQQLVGGGSHRPGSENLDLLMDVTLPISIELGRTTMNIQEILNLGPGSVVELNKLAGEPVDLLVNNKIVARGEVVVIEEKFGIRVTSLVSTEERVRSLGE